MQVVFAPCYARKSQKRQKWSFLLGVAGVTLTRLRLDRQFVENFSPPIGMPIGGLLLIDTTRIQTFNNALLQNDNDVLV